MTGPGYAELFQRGFDAWAEGTFDRFAREAWHPDVVLHDPPDVPDAGRHAGREAAIRRFHEYTESLGRFHVDVDDLIEHGDVVVVVGRMSGTSSQGAVPFSAELAYVTRFRDGKVVEVQIFQDRGAALAAAGIPDR